MTCTYQLKIVIIFNRHIFKRLRDESTIVVLLHTRITVILTTIQSPCHRHTLIFYILHSSDLECPLRHTPLPSTCFETSTLHPVANFKLYCRTNKSAGGTRWSGGNERWYQDPLGIVTVGWLRKRGKRRGMDVKGCGVSWGGAVSGGWT